MIQKIAIPTATFLFFATMMAMLVRNQIIPRIQYGTALPVQAKQIGEEWTDIDEAMSVRLNEDSLGLLRQTVSKNEELGGYDGSTVFLLRGDYLNADLLVQSWMNEDLQLESVSVSFRQKNLGEVLALTGLIKGTDLLVKIESPTGARFRVFNLGNRPTLNISTSNMLDMLLENPNEQYVLNVYEPIWGLSSSQQAIVRLGNIQEIEVNGEQVIASVVESKLNAFESKQFYNERNELVRRTIAWANENKSSSRQSIPGFEIVMDRVAEHELMAESDELLSEIDEHLRVRQQDVTGEDYGEVPALFSLPGMLFKNSF